LAHRADFDRLTGEPDAFHKVKPVYAELHRNVPCRLSTASGDRERTTDDTADLVERSFKLFVDPELTLREDDLVLQVRDAGGRVLASELDVVAIKPLSDGRVVHHLELSLEVRRGARQWQ